jgi:AraC-like DNA-binding protein
MLADDVDAATVAFEVGYESASQFNREYSRLFGQANDQVDCTISRLRAFRSICSRFCG